MRVLFLDCANGATSAMIVGALADAGLKPSALEWEFSNIEIGDFHMHFDAKERDGTRGIAFTLHAGATHSHGTGGAGDCCGHHPEEGEDDQGKTLADLRTLIEGSDLSDRVKAIALDIYERLAAAEALAQGTSPEAARLYEGGTLEGIAQVVAIGVGVEALGIERVIVSPLREGKGWIQNASGGSEVPSPVTLALLKEAPLTIGTESFQLLAPFPSAILAGLAGGTGLGGGFGERPAFEAGEGNKGAEDGTTRGYGISTRRFPPLPAVVGAEIGEVI